MSNKTSIIAKIQEFLTLNGGLTTRAEHERILFNSDESIVEAFYSDSVIESTISSEGTDITIPNANFDYKVKLNKVGSDITISGVIAANATTPSGSTIFEFDNTDYYSQIGNSFGISLNQSTGENIGLEVSNNLFTIKNTVVNGEAFNFSITYTSLN